MLKLFKTLITTILILIPLQAYAWTDKGIIDYRLIPESNSFAEGLTQQTITSVVEDSKGYLWIGTTSGLNRFDGRVFKHYLNNSRGLKSSFIQSLYTKNGLLLVGTYNGLFEYSYEHDNFKKIDFKPQSIWSITEINNDKVIVGLEKEVFILELNTRLVVESFKSPLFQDVKSAYIYGDILFVRNQSGDVIEFNIKTKVSKVILSGTRALTFKNGIAYFAGKVNHKKNKTDINIKNLGNVSDAKTFKSKQYVLKKNRVLIDNKYHLRLHEHSSPTNLHITKNYLLTTNKSNTGLKAYSKRKNSLIRHSSINSPVWYVDAHKGRAIISDETSSIKIVDSSGHIKHEIDIGIVGLKYSIILGDYIWVSGAFGVVKIHLSNYTKEKVWTKPIYTIAKSLDGDSVYFADHESEIFEYSTKNNAIRTLEKLNESDPIFQMFEIQPGVLAILSQSGIYQVSRSRKEKLFNSQIVNSIADGGKFIYFSTQEGIFTYNKKNKSVKKIVPSKKTFYALAFSENTLIASGIKEVLIYKGNNKYTITDNHGSQLEYNSQSIAKVGGNFIIGGSSGLSILTPSLIDTLERPNNKKVHLSELLVFNKPIAIGENKLKKSLDNTKELTLKYIEHPFTIVFSSPKIGIEKVEYKYRLMGLSDDWVSEKRNGSATYTNIPPGNYTFQVYALDSLSQKPGPINSLNIIITPPWWLSLEAKLLYTLLACISIFAVFRAIWRRQQTQKQIVLNEERLKLSLWGSGDEMWDWDIESGKIFRSNIWGSLEFPRDGQRSGYKGEESNIHPMDQSRVRESLDKHFHGETDHFEAAYRVKAKDGQWLWILDRAKIVERDQDDNALRMTGTIKNINNFKHAEEQLRLFERAIENISEGVFILDSNYRFVEVNEACCSIAMKSRNYFIGQILRFDLYPEHFSDKIRAILRQQSQWYGEVEASKGDGSSFSMELTIDAIYDEVGELSHYVGVFSDISIRKKQEEELRKLTNTDLLTGLPNRSNLQVTLDHIVKKEAPHALMVLDIDNFKRINDSLGHQVGDELLMSITSRIQKLKLSNSNLYRLGGDEFAILIDDSRAINSSAATASRIIDCFSSPFSIENEKLTISASIGIVLYPEDEVDEKALLRKADIAMYYAKSAGGNRYQFYSESLNQSAIKQLETENLIRDGLRDDLFEVYYQPKVNIKLNKISGMEALVRLNHPVFGLVPPNEFIPFAESNGLIVEIGDIVLRKACFAAHQWLEAGLFEGRVAVNLSSYQFALPDLVDRIEATLKLTKLPAEHLELEITEGTVIKDPEKAIEVMNKLAGMGVQLALDDFGTGYSSLSYLKRFPIHTLKIDKSFVDDIDKSDQDMKMVDSIITIAHNMGLSVIGEGVEDTSQVNILKGLDCTEIQGFVFSKPVPEQELTALLKKRKFEETTKNFIYS